MRSLAWIPICLALLFLSPAHAQDQAQEPAVECLSIANAEAQDARIAAATQAAITELSKTDILSLNALLGNMFNDTVDIATLFVYQDGSGDFTIGSRANDIKCSADAFVLSPEQVHQLLRVIKATGV